VSGSDLRARIAELEDDLRDELAAWEWDTPNPSSAPDDLIATILGVFRPALEQAQADLDEQRASFDQRLRDVQDEYARAGASWDTTRDRLNARIAEAEAELTRFRADLVAVSNEAADLEGALVDVSVKRLEAEAERDRLRAAVERVRDLAEIWASFAPPDDWGDTMQQTVAADCGRRVLAALDQAPAEEASGT